VTNEPAVRDVPLSGGAAVRGPAGTLTVQWLTFGPLADAELTDIDLLGLGDAPLDTELAALAGQTLRQVADDLAGRGVHLRFTGEHRDRFPDRLVEAVAAEAAQQEVVSLVQLRAKTADVAPAEAIDGLDRLEIRPLDLDADWDAYLRLHAATTADGFHRAMETPEGIRARLEQVAESGLDLRVVPDPELPGQILASVATVLHRSGPESPPIGEISLLAVDADWRRRGLGRLLVADATTRLAGQGVRTALAYVPNDREAARALFESLGFKARARRAYYA
jgi:ribosomal protein S18 acetylase RimI-like enzyme